MSPKSAQTTRRDAHCKYCGKPAVKKALPRYLCRVHFAAFLARLDKKPESEQTVRYCAGEKCNNIIWNPGSSKYCSPECSYLGKRVFDDDFITLINNHPWIETVTMMIKRNPYGLASVSGLAGIASLLQACAEIARFQYYTTENIAAPKTGVTTPRKVPLRPVQLGHRYPTTAGGSNYRKGLTKTPVLINQKLKAQIHEPVTAWGKTYFGDSIRIKGPARPLRGRLIRHLRAQYPAETVIARLSKVRPAFEYARTLPDKTLPAAPMMAMLLHELQHYGPKGSLGGLSQVLMFYPAIPGCWGEVLAVAGFIALQTQDADGLLEALAFRHYPLRPRTIHPEEERLNQGQPYRRYFLEGTYIYDILQRAQHAIYRCFRFDMIAQPDKMVACYQRMFHKPPEAFTLPLLGLIATDDPHHPYYDTSKEEHREQ